MREWGSSLSGWGSKRVNACLTSFGVLAWCRECPHLLKNVALASAFSEWEGNGDWWVLSEGLSTAQEPQGISTSWIKRPETDAGSPWGILRLSAYFGIVTSCFQSFIELWLGGIMYITLKCAVDLLPLGNRENLTSGWTRIGSKSEGLEGLLRTIKHGLMQSTFWWRISITTLQPVQCVCACKAQSCSVQSPVLWHLHFSLSV